MFLPSLRVHFNRVTLNLIDSDTIIRGVTELKIHPQYSRPLNQLVRFVCDLINLFQEMTFKGAK